VTTPPDADYPFRAVQGAAVSEIPVGPIHAGIIEPGHFRFQVVGEEVLRLEERLGYVHKGIEKLAEGRDVSGLLRLAGRVSGDSTVAHAWAAAQACERALSIEVPRRALLLRALACERERIANHLGDVGAICNDVGFAFAHMQFGRLREQWLRRNAEAFGHRLMMDWVVPGGVAGDLDAGLLQPMREDQAQLADELGRLERILLDNASLDDRLVGTGRLSRGDAEALGCLGYVGRASGLSEDVRHDQPYPPYDELPLRVPVREEGDVAARLYLRIDEMRVSLRLLHELLNRLQPGPVRVACPLPGDEVEGLGRVEGWRGEVLAFVRLDAGGRVLRYFPRDPSWFNWPALERLIQDNIVPDFPVCNKSVNGSYSGV
ncbi:MAG: Ni,Fe-hydrogenase III large subunit, partial [Gammaproteobacteria bacterium]